MINPILRNVCLPAALLLLGTAAHAQTTYYITVNTTLNATNPITGSAFFGYANQNDLNSRANPTSPTVNLVSGGSVSDELVAFNSSNINVSGGSVGNSLTVGGSLFAQDSSIVNLTSGSVSGDMEAQNSSTVNISGGNVSHILYIRDSSIVNISGGSVGVRLQANNSSTLNLFGTGQIATFVNSNLPGFSQYSLSGALSDGTLLVNKTLYVQNGTGARFTLNNVAAVPEPGSVALLVGLTTMGAGFLRRRRRAH